MTRTLVLLAITATVHATAPSRYAIVVGNNRSLDPKVSPLEFADDAAARYAELLGAAGDDVVLLAVLDTASQRVHGNSAHVELTPTRAALLETLSKIFSRMRADRQAGRSVVFTFVIIGHGDVGTGGNGTQGPTGRVKGGSATCCRMESRWQHDSALWRGSVGATKIGASNSWASEHAGTGS